MPSREPIEASQKFLLLDDVDNPVSFLEPQRSREARHYRYAEKVLAAKQDTSSENLNPFAARIGDEVRAEGWSTRWQQVTRADLFNDTSSKRLCHGEVGSHVPLRLTEAGATWATGTVELGCCRAMTRLNTNPLGEKLS